MTRPMLGVTCDLNDVYWGGQSQFAADILQWQRMGLSSVLLLSGDAARANAVLPAADAAGFGVVCGGMTETKAYLDNGADTQAAADAVVGPIAAMLVQHPSVEAVLAAATAENAQLTAALANAQAELTTRTVERDAAQAEVATLTAAINAACSHWAALRAHLEAA